MAVIFGGCGKHAAKAKLGDTGSSGSAASDPKSPWKFVGFVDAPRHQVAVVTTGVEAALVDGTGTLTAPIKIASDQIVAKGNGELVLLSAGDTFVGIDARGRTTWSANLPPGQASFGSSAFATATTKDSSVVALATGKPLYNGKPATQLAYHAHDGFVFGDAAELWFVDEATGAERWRQELDVLDAALVPGRSSVFVLHPDRTFQEVDVASGKPLSKGTCEGKPPGPEDHPKTSECAGYPNVDLSKENTGGPLKDGDNGDYYGHDKGKEGTYLVARDPAGRIRWRTAAQLQVDALEGPFRDVNEAKEVAFVSGKGDVRTLLVLDDTGGKLLFQHKLENHERLRGSTGLCWLVVNDRHASCLDHRSGAPTWNVVTSGRAVEAWPLAGGAALLVDGDPVTLSRVEKDGRRAWQTALPDTTLEHAKDPDKVTAPFMGNHAWEFSDIVGIVSGKDGLVVIDLATGKVGKVH